MMFLKAHVCNCECNVDQKASEPIRLLPYPGPTVPKHAGQCTWPVVRMGQTEYSHKEDSPDDAPYS